MQNWPTFIFGNHIPGGRSITVRRPVLLVRPPVADGAGEWGSVGSSESPAGDADRSSVQPTVWRFKQPRPCIYLMKDKKNR